MAVKLSCLAATVLGAALGACLPASDSEEQAAEAEMRALVASDAPLEIAINQFPGGYQGRWAMTPDACAEDPENSPNAMSLQGKLVKFHESIGTMTEGKRKTSRSMDANFEFLGEGEKSTKSIAFQLSKDGKSLTRTDGDGAGAYRYVHCPKLMAG